MREGDVTTEAEVRVMQSQKPRMWQPLEADTGEEIFSPTASERNQPCQQLNFSLVRLILYF